MFIILEILIETIKEISTQTGKEECLLEEEDIKNK